MFKDFQEQLSQLKSSYHELKEHCMGVEQEREELIKESDF